jgi:hypothetical protein
MTYKKKAARLMNEAAWQDNQKVYFTPNSRRYPTQLRRTVEVSHG